MRNARFRPYWIQAEEKECQGLWDKNVFKTWRYAAPAGEYTEV
jgi:hypothetical protein